MTPVSFIYCFHSSRAENLRQALRLLFKREKCIGEVILVCNDEIKEEFENCRLYSMGLSNYEKNKMCNFGVFKTSYEIVALLDSDRVLPEGYFAEVADRMRPGLLFSCERMLNLRRPHTDEEIDSGEMEFDIETRSLGWEPRRKNLFSGNTTFMKKDYLSAGGMDERFVGYGFADNDMTYNMLNRGMRAEWMNSDEIHLHHEKKTMERGEMVGFDRYKHTSQRNLCRFLRKWRLTDHEDYNRKMML